MTVILNWSFSHSNSSKTTMWKIPLQITSDLQRVFLPGGLTTIAM